MNACLPHLSDRGQGVVWFEWCGAGCCLLRCWWLAQVPMRQVTLEAMESLLLRYKGRYTAVVGFKPTGWSHAGGSGRGGLAGGAAAAVAAAPAPVTGPSRSSLSIKPNRRHSQRGTVVLYQVCCEACVLPPGAVGPCVCVSSRRHVGGRLDKPPSPCDGGGFVVLRAGAVL